MKMTDRREYSSEKKNGKYSACYR